MIELIHLPAFCLGIQEQLQKTASGVMDTTKGENIIPQLKKQSKWRYAHSDTGLKLSDGHNVYSFDVPLNFPAEDTRITKLEGHNVLNFEEGANNKGVAQIHHSSPNSLYVTLADGKGNPTFKLEHEHNEQWRYSPSRKFADKLKRFTETSNVEDAFHPVDAEALIHGGTEHIKKAYFDATDAANGLRALGTGAAGLMAFKATHPLTAASLAVAAANAGSHVAESLSPSYSRQIIMNPKKALGRKFTFPVLASLGTTAAYQGMMH